MYWYFAVIFKYAVFDGRSHREEFWTYILWYVLVLLVLVALAAMVGLHWVVLILYRLALAFPSIAAIVRRLHDTGRSGWWCLIGLIPIAGTIVLVVYLAQDGQPYTNRYGPNPKTVT